MTREEDEAEDKAGGSVRWIGGIMMKACLILKYEAG